MTIRQAKGGFIITAGPNDYGDYDDDQMVVPTLDALQILVDITFSEETVKKKKRKE